MVPKLSRTIGMAGAAGLLATAGCKKQAPEVATQMAQAELNLSTENGAEREGGLQRDMTHAAPFERTGEVKYGEFIPRELLDQQVYGFDRETYDDLKVAGSGKDLIKKGVRAQVHTILATDRSYDEVKQDKEPGNLIDPLKVPVGKENGAIWISTVIPPRPNGDELFGNILYYCLDEDGKAVSETEANPIPAVESGHARWRGWVHCANKPGPFGVAASISDRRHDSFLYYSRMFNAVEADEAK